MKKSRSGKAGSGKTQTESRGLRGLVTSSANGRGFLGGPKGQPKNGPTRGAPDPERSSQGPTGRAGAGAASGSGPAKKFKSYKELMAFDPEEDKDFEASGPAGPKPGYKQRAKQSPNRQAKRSDKQKKFRKAESSASGGGQKPYRSKDEKLGLSRLDAPVSKERNPSREQLRAPARPERGTNRGSGGPRGGGRGRDQKKEDVRPQAVGRKPERTPGPSSRGGRPLERGARVSGRDADRGGNRPPQRSGERPAPPLLKRRGQNHTTEFVEGIVKRHPDGFGFIVCDDTTHPDVYVSRQYMTGIMTNDRVRADVFKSRDDDRYFGEPTKVLKRANSRVVGKFLPVDLKYGVILDDNKGWGNDLRIAMADAMHAKEGDMVVAEIISYPDRDSDFTGKILEVIGDSDDPINDVIRVIHTAHIPNEFSAQAVADARSYGAKVTEKDIEGRVDLRHLDLITIDGATARDFDDAVYVETDKVGFHLWVAIADVSNYVKVGTALDDDAFERGTSTYFPNYVVPMLPEELSNDLCSLNPKVPRLCFVSEMRINYQGDITSYEFYEAVMESKARVTYGQAQEVIDGHVPQELRHVKDAILRAGDLAKILMAHRFQEGSLDLEIPETQVVVDKAGRSVDIIKSERLFAHRLIEELMLAANISAARFIDQHEIPGLYRIHEPPFEENLETLNRFLHNFGAEAQITGGKLQKKISKALQLFDGKPEAQILNILTLRTMNQAKYARENRGHFGLGFSHYAHFTSPIRRYPDLIVHRLIKSLVYPRYEKYRMDEEDLDTAGMMLSACEQRSAKAERQVVSIKKARFMQQFVGQEFDGMISSVTKFGCFVLLRSYDVDGLVKLEALGNDYFIYDEENLRLYGKRSGIVYKIGDPIRVQVASVDTDAGRIDLIVADDSEETDESDENNGDEESGSDPNTEKNRNDAQKRRAPKDDRGRVREKRVPKRRRKT